MISTLAPHRSGESAPLLCIGHSHVACVARAARAASVPLQAIDFWTMPDAIVRGDGPPRFSPSLAAQLRKHVGPVFSLIGGAAHGVIGMLVHPRRFDVVLPWQPDLPLDPTSEVLPALAVRAILEAAMVEYLDLLNQLRTLCSGPLFHVESPPPFADPQRMHDDIPWALYPGMLQEISPAWMRYKLWRMHSRIVEDWCLANDATMISCPPLAMDVEGFLREPYYGDGAHANDAYGSLVLEQMRQLA